MLGHAVRKAGVRASLVGATALLIGGLAPPAARAETYGGVVFPQGAVSFADAVTSFAPVIKNGQPTSPYRVPGNVLGTPNNIHTTLGDGGAVTVRFLDNVLTGSGTTAKDLWVFEVGPDVEATYV